MCHLAAIDGSGYLNKTDCFIDILKSDLQWYTIIDPVQWYPSKQAAAKQVGEWLDKNPESVYRIRDYWGGLVWTNLPS